MISEQRVSEMSLTFTAQTETAAGRSCPLLATSGYCADERPPAMVGTGYRGCAGREARQDGQMRNVSITVSRRDGKAQPAPAAKPDRRHSPRLVKRGRKFSVPRHEWFSAVRKELCSCESTRIGNSTQR